nr:MAG TPA: hypothetical protein [Caudoviricetes sp.]
MTIHVFQFALLQARSTCDVVGSCSSSFIFNRVKELVNYFLKYLTIDNLLFKMKA